MRMVFRIQNPLVALACGQFALSLMQVMFMFYYVKVYLNIFHVPQVWFNIAQSMFLVWNAINDPLFGYLQEIHGSWLNNRTMVIKFFAPFMGLSFAFMWFPWSTDGSWIEGVHLILSLFLYDAFFSAIGVAWSALFADSTKEPRIRVSAMKYSQLSILLSVNIIAVTEKLSHSLENIFVFQLVTISIAIVGIFCLYTCGSLQLGLPVVSYNEDSTSLLDDEDKYSNNRHLSSWNSAVSMTKQIVFDGDFRAIVASNFIHTARSVAHMNFASTATEILIPQTILAKGSLRLSLFYGVVTLLPQLLLIGNERIVIKYGAYRVMMASYYISVLSGFMYLFSSNAYLILIFMIIDSITVHAIAPLFNIIVSDFVDQDAKHHNRKSTVASLIFSLNALFVKPAISLCPVLIVYLLNNHGYEAYLVDKSVSSNLSSAMCQILFATPLLLGSIQVIVFRSYSLGDKHLTKEMRLTESTL